MRSGDPQGPRGSPARCGCPHPTPRQRGCRSLAAMHERAAIVSAAAGEMGAAIDRGTAERGRVRGRRVRPGQRERPRGCMNSATTPNISRSSTSMPCRQGSLLLVPPGGKPHLRRPLSSGPPERANRVATSPWRSGELRLGGLPDESCMATPSRAREPRPRPRSRLLRLTLRARIGAARRAHADISRSTAQAAGTPRAATSPRASALPFPEGSNDTSAVASAFHATQRRR